MKRKHLVYLLAFAAAFLSALVMIRPEQAFAGTLQKGDDGVFYYLDDDGEFDDEYVGLVKYGKNWWYVNNGTIDYESVTLVKYKSKWYYVRNGRVDRSYTGVFQYRDNVVYDIEKGVNVGRHALSKSYKKLLAYIKENGIEDKGDYVLYDHDSKAEAAVQIRYNTEEKRFYLIETDDDAKYTVYTVVDTSIKEVTSAVLMKDNDPEKLCYIGWEDGFAFDENLAYEADGIKDNDDLQTIVNRETRYAMDYWIFLLNINGFHGEALRLKLYEP